MKKTKPIKTTKLKVKDGTLYVKDDRESTLNQHSHKKKRRNNQGEAEAVQNEIHNSYLYQNPRFSNQDPNLKINKSLNKPSTNL